MPSERLSLYVDSVTKHSPSEEPIWNPIFGWICWGSYTTLAATWRETSNSTASFLPPYTCKKRRASTSNLLTALCVLLSFLKAIEEIPAILVVWRILHALNYCRLPSLLPVPRANIISFLVCGPIFFPGIWLTGGWLSSFLKGHSWHLDSSNLSKCFTIAEVPPLTFSVFVCPEMKAGSLFRWWL